MESSDKADPLNKGRKKTPTANQRTVRPIFLPPHFKISSILIGKQAGCRRVKWEENSQLLIDFGQRKNA